VTGMPNFDNCSSYFQNDFPHRGYVLVAPRICAKLSSATIGRSSSGAYWTLPAGGS